jgi:hypothetical protein
MPKVTRTGRPKRRPRALSVQEQARERELRRSRAHEELFDIRVVPHTPFVHLDIVNPLHGTRYDVFVPGYPDLGTATCGCTDFTTRGLGTCKHLEAVRLWIGENRAELDALPRAEPEAGPVLAEIWRRIDDRIAELRREPRALFRRARHAGAALYERPGA